MRHLQEDAGAVAGVVVAAAGAAVFEVLEDLDGLAEDVVRFAVLQIDDEADAAGIVFVRGIIKTLSGGDQWLCHDLEAP